MPLEAISSELGTNRRWTAPICLLLLVAILAVYGPLISSDFVNYDDDLYVTENDQVRLGLTWRNLGWSFRTFWSANWHPLTWLSHMADVELYGLNAGGHHLTNIIFHIANTLLLFLLLGRMSNAFWRSAFVATLFALHPLHVESVAWVAERKDVLSTFFGLLALISYLRYTRRRSRSAYGLALLCFMLALMAKPMLVTLPFVLLLLDCWPLGRLDFSKGFRLQPAGGVSGIYFLVLEKLPFFMLTAASCMVTYYAQQSGGAMMPSELYPLGLRISNAIVVYVGYIGKMLWPARLAVFYPLPESFAFWQVGIAAVLMLSGSLAVVAQIRQRPYLAVGWFWYVGTLVPVIGLVQVGGQAMADRYTYIPLIGLFIMLVWGAAEIFERRQVKHLFAVLATVVFMLVLSAAARMQVGHWADSMTLFSHSLKVTRQNALAHNNLAEVLTERGRYDEALKHIRAALDLRPKNASVYNNLGYILLLQENRAEAIYNFKVALKLFPEYTKAHYNLATTSMMSGKLDAAVSHYQAALELDPDRQDILNDLANALFEQGRVTEALAYYSKALRLNSRDPELHNNVGVALIYKGRSKEAVKHFRLALRLNPDFTDARENLRKALNLQQ